MLCRTPQYLLDKFLFTCNNVCNTLGYSEGFTHMSRTPDYDHLYAIAEAQAGYFTALQARDAGFSWERLSSNTQRGKFLRVSYGIYRLVQFPSSPFEDLFVVWLRTGPDSVISHDSALALYNLSDVLPSEVHVIVPRTASRRRRGIRLHTNRINPDEITAREGLPVTTVERTIADVIFSGLAAEQVNKGIYDAINRGLTTRKDLLKQAEHYGGKVGRMIRSTLEEDKQE
jgi:predicted transcriptional regulator of viral defense system